MVTTIRGGGEKDTGINDVFVAEDGTNDEPYRYHKLFITRVITLLPLDNDVEIEYQHYLFAFRQNQFWKYAGQTSWLTCKHTYKI